MQRFFLLTLFVTLFFSCKKETVFIVLPDEASSSMEFGALRLQEALQARNYSVNLMKAMEPGTNKNARTISLSLAAPEDSLSGKEAYSIMSEGQNIRLRGSDASGALYACIELAGIVKERQTLPSDIRLKDKPEMVLRGTCIGVQKMEYLPGRGVYEYPYTPESFPWFYDKELWIKYLDQMVENKFNSLYLWNGHPFASLVKLDDYPYAVEVDEETFAKNEVIFAFLTEEAEKRGIWVIQMFYNIFVSKPFAEHHGIKTQDRSRPITPLISDYTRKSIAAFIEKYPHVGLLVCLGEAMDTYEDDVEWFTKTIIPGVQDGLKALGTTEEPPIVVRAHDTDCNMVMSAALPIYKNLYTMHKYNGESLTTYEPRGPWSKIHTDLSSLGSIHISNVHILANLEPFRYGSPGFIQKTVKAMRGIHGANALHLYPQASYWDWPYTADKTENRLLEMDRDWIWYAAWARYAWNPNRERGEELVYWTMRLDEMYGSGESGKEIITAYDEMGEIAPKLLRKFGITEGNRQTLLLGMFMSQLVNPAKWNVYPGFHDSCGPEGEMLVEYMEKEWEKLPHKGETPQQLIDEAVAHGQKAVEAIEKAVPSVKKNKAEFERLRNDVHCYEAFAQSFSYKVKAAMAVLRYTHSGDIGDLDKAVPLLEESLAHYRRLVDLTKDTYLYANSMQTQQRRIPIGGDKGTNKTWAEMLVHYEKELANVKKNIQFLKEHGGEAAGKVEVLQPVAVDVANKPVETYPLRKGEKVFADGDWVIKDVCEELKQMKAMRFKLSEQADEGTSITFESKEPVQLLVGFLNTERREYAKAPTLETDAGANEFGQGDVKIANAIDVSARGTVNVHAYTYPAGKHTLTIGKGGVMVLGFIKASQTIQPRNAGLGGDGQANSKIDWLFY